MSISPDLLANKRSVTLGSFTAKLTVGKAEGSNRSRIRLLGRLCPACAIRRGGGLFDACVRLHDRMSAALFIPFGDVIIILVQLFKGITGTTNGQSADSVSVF
jgi:hypothetical protein